MLNLQEIDLIYKLLDEIPTRGEETKELVLSSMRKLRQMKEELEKQSEGKQDE